MGLVLKDSDHLSIDVLRQFLKQNKDLPEQDLVDYLRQWWAVDDDKAYRAALEVNPSWIRLFPFVASATKDWGEDLPGRAVAHYRKEAVHSMVEITAWERWLQRWLEKQSSTDSFSWSYPLADLAATEVSDELLRSFAAGLGLAENVRLVCTLTNKDLCRRLFKASPAGFAEGLREAWQIYQADPRSRWASPLDIPIGPLGAEALLQDDLLLGFSLGVRACEKGIGVKQREFWKSANFWPFAVVDFVQLDAPDESLRQANLWALLRRLADLTGHSQRTAKLGVNAEILEFAKNNPDTWALALPLIVDRLDLLQGTGESVTVLLATISKRVYHAIEVLCNDPRFSARAERSAGIRAMVRNILSPNHELVALVMDTVSRWVDRSYIFPHPLAIAASTWMGSLEIENAIRAAVVAAEFEFRDHFRTSSGLDEDIHTSQLLSALERNLMKETFSLSGLSSLASRRPIASVKYRQSSKQIEEPRHGLDLALIINAKVQDRLTYEAAQLVQVKKLRRHSAVSTLSHYWTIKLEQLTTLLRTSASACYWFFDERGTVPAKLLSAIGAARPQIGESFSVSHFEIRSIAVSLSQFFVDLFIGGWSGEIAPDVLRIARGEDPLIQPRFIATLGIEWQRPEERQ